MKLFIKRLFLFIIPIAIFLCSLELTLQIIPNNYSYKNDLLRKNAKDIEILVLGSSQSLYGVNPEYFTKKGFNAAHLSQSFKYDYFIFNKYKDNLKNLKVLVLPISYFSFFYQLEDSAAKWRIKKYSLYYDCNYHSELTYNSELFGIKPYIAFKRIFYYFLGNSVTVSDTGFVLRNIDAENQTCLYYAGPVAAKRHTNLNIKLLQENFIILNKIIDECNKMGVKVVLFTPPAVQTYRDNLDKKQLSLMMQGIQEVLHMHSNVEYYNFFGDTRIKHDYFQDADHLNAFGAKKLTIILNDLIDKSDSVENN